ncbi:hypothetical protein RJJ65_09165 [Rhizobium hidalgonense]|uniref:DUF4129 domain-containing protein n=1 Tax=Rhizobium hidalgonense TaxID=1538159 RepID=A0A2A6KEC3_9HYPH|nr:hypothetical protein [Rhizobium hidalgonense]MDR9772826.1 hypothetical protein [Rhizobium hidalgonense]MDR9812947.1 hypothetical protein [Rhizobium hidalgonense]MDR9820286.1 hypothetical protein [Rhizobium hidalgonense]PDT23043.1 hypothetical protein CO674_13935 [Rhizobium hidalgonense]PON01286.1 hypothetical protein ATY29_34405 [Rhizobium hidalgonense]
MTLRNAGLLVALFLATLAPFPPAQAQDSARQQVDGGTRQSSAAGAEYASQCRQNGLRCTLIYGDGSAKDAPASNTTTSSPQRKPLFIPREPVISGPLAVAVVLVGLIVVIGLWMRFGNGGILLSSAPRDMKRQGEAPESWRTAAAEAEEEPNDVLQRIAAMADRRQAVVLLLRHCLLHAADISGTRLFRSDTERAVFARLPNSIPDRERLANFLTAVELVHYGGRAVAENHFSTLLATARDLLSVGRLTHA